MNCSQMKDERLLLFYDAVRQQVILDGSSPYRFAGEGVRAYAERLREDARDSFVLNQANAVGHLPQMFLIRLSATVV